MPVTYGYYIYHNEFKAKEIPSLQCDGFLTAKVGDTTTIVKWVGGPSVEKTKQDMAFEIGAILQDCDPETKQKFSEWGHTIYHIVVEKQNSKLLEFGKITFDETSKTCSVEATCTTK